MAHPIVMPSYGMYTAEGILAAWLVPSGSHVQAGDIVAEIETEKATADVTAPASGVLHHVVAPGAELEVEGLIGWILAVGEEAPPPWDDEDEEEGTAEYGSTPSTAPAPAIPVPAVERPASGIVASPNARRVATELHVELSTVMGTGPGGRITEEDVRRAAQ